MDQKRPFIILIADDDAEDCLLMRDALEEACEDHELRFVRDGEQLCDYLTRRGDYADGATAPRPDLILLDMKMPKKDGREALKQIKADPALRCIPVIVLTTSTADIDVRSSYDLGANAYTTKPVTFRGLVELMSVLCKFWLEMVVLPPPE